MQESSFHSYFLPLLRKADVLLYQPLSNKFQSFSTDNILKQTKAGCVKISFPYIYNSACSPLYEESLYSVNKKGEPYVSLKENIKDSSVILEMIKNKVSLRQAITKLIKLEINFDLEERYKFSLEILTQKEENTHIKVTKYIQENIQNERLFLTQNHPSSNLLIYCANQILDILGLNRIPYNASNNINEAGLPGFYFISPYENCFNYKYDTENINNLFRNNKSQNWKTQLIKLIGKAYINQLNESQKFKAETYRIYTSYRKSISK